jgi:hypothetical protein
VNQASGAFGDRALQHNVGTVPRTVRILDYPIELGNDNHFVMPSKDGIQEINIKGGKIEKNKTGNIIYWIVFSSDYCLGAKYF